MPIYVYKCAACGFTQDEMQKIADAPLTQCPACAASMYVKQLTAVGFALKGGGWYATDFKGGVKPEQVTDRPAESADKKTEPAAAHACGASTCPSCH